MQWLILFFLFLGTSTLGNIRCVDLLVNCEKIAPRQYRLEWEPPNGEKETIYHIFASTDWNSLMPVEMPQEFIGAQKSGDSLLLSTKACSVEIETIKPYMRIIADTCGVFCDVAPLLHFPKDVISKKREFNPDERQEIFEKVQPYLIPDTHPCKAKLDAIFSKRGVLTSPDTMKQSGFDLLCYREGRGLIVAAHPELKGHLVKTYLDSSKHVEWSRWIRRAKGSLGVQKCIKEYKKYAQDIKVPKKWIYRLPEASMGSYFPDAVPREYILLVEDMRIFSIEKTKRIYANKVSYRALEGLFLIIDKSGYSDSHIGNVPFSRDGRIALIDTEYTNNWPVHPEWLTKWFSPTKQNFWNRLILQQQQKG